MQKFVFTELIEKSKFYNLWGVECGDYYSEFYHQVQGGTQKLLDLGYIEPELIID